MKNKLYYYSPPFIKNIIASAYGRRLYNRRYSNKYFVEALPEIINRQSWTNGQLKEYQDKSINNLIRVAAQYVPYYRELFKTLKLKPGDVQTAEELISILPILEKSEIKSNPGKFVDERLNLEKLNKVYTSGTTGSPLCIYRDYIADGLAYAYTETRWRMPYGVTKDSVWAMIGGKLVVPQEQVKPPFWVWNSGLNQLYMSSYHLSIEFAKDYLYELRRRHLDYIYGYASSLYSLALFAKELGFYDLTFNVTISNAEPLYDYQRELIENMFNCRVVDTYGCTEWCFQAYECLEKKLHVSPDVGLFEVVDSDGKSVHDGEVGEVVCTGFVNLAQPLIRYRVGDSARISKEECNCGSNFPVLQSVEGRNDDLIILKDGRRIGRMDPIFKGQLPIMEAQIIQNNLMDFTIKLIPDKEWDKNKEQILIKNFCDYIGKVNVTIDIVKAIQRTKSGKFKAVVNNIDKQFEQT